MMTADAGPTQVTVKDDDRQDFPVIQEFEELNLSEALLRGREESFLFFF